MIIFLYLYHAGACSPIRDYVGVVRSPPVHMHLGVPKIKIRTVIVYSYQDKGMVSPEPLPYWKIPCRVSTGQVYRTQTFEELLHIRIGWTLHEKHRIVTHHIGRGSQRKEASSK